MIKCKLLACGNMGIRLTDKRKKILNLIKNNNGLLSASEIHNKLPKIDLVTIYRNLDLFSKENLIIKVQLGTGEFQYEYQKEPHHHAVCVDCKKVIHFSTNNEEIKKLLNLKDFKIDEIDLLVKGRCQK